MRFGPSGTVSVVDASAALELLLQTPAAPAVESRLLDSSDLLHAPHLLDLEVAQVLRRYERSGDLSGEAAEQRLGLFAAFPIRRHAHAPLLARIWALRAAITAYDAAYVALAEALDEPLITRDRRLASARGHRARIELV
jgi:predicted nucleic acid-binding protein